MSLLRRTIVYSLAISIAFGTLPADATAEMTMSMFLAPHCTASDRSTCPTFDVVDPSTVKTGKLAAGDILDLDIVVAGQDYSSVRSVRAWLNYDPQVLEYRSVELSSELPSPTAGEQTSDPVGKVVKVGGSTEKGLTGDNRAVARVTFRVLATTNDTTLTFNDYKADGKGHTAVNGPYGNTNEKQGALPPPPCIGSLIGCRGTPQPLLGVEPSKLSVTLTETNSVVPTVAAASLIQDAMPPVANAEDLTMSASSSSTPTAAIASSAPTGDSTFGILQVQGVKVTTRDTTVFVGWKELKSAGLKGYNVYYSTVSGRYIQRRSVPKDQTSITIRNLNPDTVYYFAVRAVNTQDQETVFSQEVSVTVGQPDTASAPLLAQAIGIQLTDDLPEGNPMEIHNGRVIRGETGTGDIMMIIAAVSAIIGTAFAFRRQMTILHLEHHAA